MLYIFLILLSNTIVSSYNHSHLYIQNTNQSFYTVILTNLTSPTFYLQQPPPHINITLQNISQTIEFTNMDYQLKFMNSYLDSENIWSYGPFYNLRYGDKTDISNKAIIKQDDGTVKQINNVYLIRDFQKVQLQGNGIILVDGQLTDYGRPVLIYTIFNNCTLKMRNMTATVKDGNLSVIENQVYWMSFLDRQIFYCEQLNILNIVQGYIMFCNGEEIQQVLFWTPQKYITQNGVRFYQATDWKKNDIFINKTLYNIHCNQLIYIAPSNILQQVYSFWTFVITTSKYPMFCHVNQSQPICDPLQIGITPIQRVNVYTQSNLNNLVILYNNQSIYIINLPQNIRKINVSQFNNKLIFLKYVDLDERFLYIKGSYANESDVFLVYQRFSFNFTIYQKNIEPSFFFIIDRLTYQQSFIFVSTDNILKLQLFRQPSLNITLSQTVLDTFKFGIMASNKYQKEEIIYTVVPTFIDKPSFFYLITCNDSINTTFNLLQFKLDHYRKFIGPDIRIKAFETMLQQGLQISVQMNEELDLQCEQDVIFISMTSYTLINFQILFRHSSGNYFMKRFIYQPNYLIHKKMVTVFKLQNNGCFTGSLQELFVNDVFLILQGSSNICICSLNFICQSIFQSQNQILQAWFYNFMIYIITDNNTEKQLNLTLINMKTKVNLTFFINKSFLGFKQNFKGFITGQVLSYDNQNIYVYNDKIYYQQNKGSTQKNFFLSYQFKNPCEIFLDILFTSQKLLIFCVNQSVVYQYFIGKYKAIFQRLIPIFGFKIAPKMQNSTNFQYSENYFSILVVDELGNFAIVIMHLFQFSVNTIKLVIPVKLPQIVSLFERRDYLNIFYQRQKNGVRTNFMHIYNRHVPVFVSEKSQNIMEYKNLSIPFYIDSWYGMSKFDFIEGVFTLDSGLILIKDMINGSSKEFQKDQQIYYQQFYLYPKDITGSVADYQLHIQEVGMKQQFVIPYLKKFFVPLKEIANISYMYTGPITTIYSFNESINSSLSNLIISLSDNSIIITEKVGGTYKNISNGITIFTEYLYILFNKTIGRFSQCQIGPLQIHPTNGSLLIFCYAYLAESNFVFSKIGHQVFISYNSGNDKNKINVSANTVQFPQIVNSFQSILQPKPLFIIKTTTVNPGFMKKLLILCPIINGSVNFSPNCTNLVNKQMDSFDIVSISSYQNRDTAIIGVLSLNQINIFFISQNTFLNSQFTSSNVTISIRNLKRKVCGQNCQFKFIKAVGSTAQTGRIILSGNIAYYQILIYINSTFHLQNKFYKYFSCFSSQNVQKLKNVFIAPCDLIYPQLGSILQLYIDNQTNSQPHYPLQIIQYFNFSFALFEPSKPLDQSGRFICQIVFTNPKLQIANIYESLIVKLSSTTDYIKLGLSLKNMYTTNNLTFSAYGSYEDQLHIIIGVCLLGILFLFLLAGVLGKIISKWYLQRKGQQNQEITYYEVQMAFEQKQGILLKIQ